MLFKEAFKLYHEYKLKFNNKLALCKADLLFRNYLIKDKKKNITTFGIKIYIVHSVLAFYSIYNIIRLRQKGVKIAHYMIDINNNNLKYDSRSDWILEVINPAESVNFMHINDIKYSLRNLFKRKNLIYFESIYYVLKPFLKIQRYKYDKSENNSLINDLLEKNQMYYNDSYYLYKISKFILKFLNINKFIMLDDSRYTNELKLGCQKLGIKTIGYMHGRFNKYHLGTFEFPFDEYMIWSEYFQNILLEDKNYHNKKLEVIGSPKLHKKFQFIKRGSNILWLGESNVVYEELFIYIENIKKMGYNIIFRAKPGIATSIDLFLEKNNISKDCSIDYFSSLEENNIGLVIATYSTTLMESWLIGIPSIALRCNYDYGSHLWEDGLIDLVDSSNLENIIEKNMRMTTKEINARLDKMWGDNYIFNKDKVKRILLT